MNCSTVNRVEELSGVGVVECYDLQMRILTLRIFTFRNLDLGFWIIFIENR